MTTTLQTTNRTKYVVRRQQKSYKNVGLVNYMVVFGFAMSATHRARHEKATTVGPDPPPEIQTMEFTNPVNFVTRVSLILVITKTTFVEQWCIQTLDSTKREKRTKRQKEKRTIILPVLQIEHR